MGQSFSLEDVAIVSLKHRGESSLGTREKAGQFTLRRYTGEYDLFGNQLYTKGQVLFDSIYRFKGQQASAVILTDVDPDQADKDRWRRLLYCGSTRACLRLEILAKRDNELNAPLFEFV